MRKLIVPAAITMLLVTPATTLAEGASRHSDRGAVHSRRSLDYEHVGAMRPGRVTAFSSQLIPHNVYEREGLSRNPEDCVIWGCVGNN
jgi:hypothetical protein